MSLPVSQYEELLEEMRGLRRKAQRVQQLATPLISSTESGNNPSSSKVTNQNDPTHLYNQPIDYTMDSVLLNRQGNASTIEYNGRESEIGQSEDDLDVASGTHMSVSSEPITRTKNVSSLYHGTWPVERTMWNSDPSSLSPNKSQMHNRQSDMTSVMSFASSSGGAPLDRVLNSPDRSRRSSSSQLEAKVDMIYSLLAMLGGQEHADMGETLLALSTNPESCVAMRQSGCIPLLVQLVQSDKDCETRKKASQALNNLINAQPDEKIKKREIRIFKLLEQARIYAEVLRTNGSFELDTSIELDEDGDPHPVQTVAHLMKLSFDEGHRQTICQLGGIRTISHLIEVEHSSHGSTPEEPRCVLLRRYVCMTLTNLTFGDSGNKALLCSYREFMRALVVQLQSPSDELRQVTASVLRNLSWRADGNSKDILREVGAVTGLMKAAMVDCNENTLKSILSALWNLSAHSTENKAEICAIEGALGFLVDLLSYKTAEKSLAIVENSGGILRNISSQIAVRDDYREILRRHNCLQVLLNQLKSPSLSIVSNACGTLWNLSAKCSLDQEALWQMGAPSMLRSLNHSKHKMIAMGSSAALKNLLSARPGHGLTQQLDSTARAMNLPVLPTLGARKQKNLLKDLGPNLTETFDDLELKNDGEKAVKAKGREQFLRSGSQECVRKEYVYDSRSTRSENGFNRDHLCSAFASLNLVDSSEAEQQGNNGLPKYYGSSSLPYVPTPDFTNDYEDEPLNEQPIDYSRRYQETKVPKATVKNYKSSRKEKNVASNYIYAETDLDQLTDYSLRYAEDDSDSDACGNVSKPHRTTEFVPDTVKTYCTEGTPYETPFNFSTATSMSDLRIDEKTLEIIDNDKNVKVSSSPDEEEKDHCSAEDISDPDGRKDPVKVKSEFSSGIMSPEKPVNYCDEGTPGYFSRVSSFGSLTSVPANEPIKMEKEATECKVPSEYEHGEKKVKIKIDQSPAEAKAVKFEQVVNYAEETPLMFSRSSSLASLDSIEQHSIHDDRSSVISDFSRLPSGVISPSELPDSPTQTVPPSPKPRKSPLDFPPKSSSTGAYAKHNHHSRPQPAPRSTQKASVFEDNVRKFKEESTPVQFSTATSLSSLTIDDEGGVSEGNRGMMVGDVDNNEASSSGVVSKETYGEMEKQDAGKEENTDVTLQDDIANLSEDDEDDEDILTACINIGMQNKRCSVQKKQTSTSQPSLLKPPSSPYRYNQKPTTTQKPTSTTPTVYSDTVKTYCTENTPAFLSRVGSNSDLSVLSVHSTEKPKRDYLSDDSSNLSGDNENILAECIKSGMPKARTPECYPTRNVEKSPQKAKNFLSYDQAKDEVGKYAVEDTPCEYSLRSSLSDLTVDGSVVALTRMVPGCSSSSSVKQKVSKSVQGSGGKDADKNLLAKETFPTQEPSPASRRDSLSSLSAESLASLEAEQALLEQCISSGMPSKNKQPPSREQQTLAAQQVTKANPKNVYVASAAGNTAPEPATNSGCPERTTTAAAGGDRAPEGSGPDRSNNSNTNNKDVNCSKSPKRSGFDDELKKSEELGFCEEEDGSCKLTESVDHRMLDPDAMIESLDRFTAELVSQASHLQNKEDMYVTSVTENSTWNEENSPNDISFPSISGTAPNVISFKSEENEPKNENYSNDFSSLNTTTMTESTLIALEATKLATVFKTEADMSHSLISAASLELDNVQPPSNLNSLTNSVFIDESRKSPRLLQRKKSFPAGMMIRKALSNSLNHCSSLESLDNNSLSNLDKMNPPSEFLDMEGSMNSVASLGSEAIDGRNCDKKNHPIFYTKNQQQSYNSITELEHINPPSIFNEITDMCSSLADVPTENFCTESDVYEDCNTHVPDLTTDITEYSDAVSITPIHSDCGSSSTDSTPKKGRNLTAKQKRTLAKDRYKTYTIAAEMVMKQESEKVKEIVDPDGQTCVKMTAKERRERNRSRFETQVVDLSGLSSPEPEEHVVRKKSDIRRNFLQKRIENKDRFKTQTLNAASSGELHRLVQAEADFVLKSLNETKSEEFLECETLSLVSNEDDSENNSGCSVNYRTYRKSMIQSKRLQVPVEEIKAAEVASTSDDLSSSEAELNGKPKIVKPSSEDTDDSKEVEAKGIRGRRKPLYTKPTSSNNRVIPNSVKPIKTVATNLVKNVTSSMKPNKPQINSIPKPESKLPFSRQNQKIPQTTPKSSKSSSPKPKLERQGTFTITPEPATTTQPKTTTKSKIPTTNPKSLPSRIAKAVTTTTNKPQPKSASSDRSTSSKLALYRRSPSVDSNKDRIPNRTVQTSSSSQSLKSEPGRSLRPAANLAQRSGSNSSVSSSGNASSKKQVTSKIASLWKKIEQSRKQQQRVDKPDGRVWIQPDSTTGDEGVVMREKGGKGCVGGEKRVSRLGSFIVMDEEREQRNGSCAGDASDMSF